MIFVFLEVILVNVYSDRLLLIVSLLLFMMIWNFFSSMFVDGLVVFCSLRGI